MGSGKIDVHKTQKIMQNIFSTRIFISFLLSSICSCPCSGETTRNDPYHLCMNIELRLRIVKYSIFNSFLCLCTIILENCWLHENLLQRHEQNRWQESISFNCWKFLTPPEFPVCLKYYSMVFSYKRNYSKILKGTSWGEF